jgi:hypothetical protein
MFQPRSLNSRGTLVIAALVLVATTRQAAAANTTYTWTGAVDNTWENASNWSPTSGPPGKNDLVTMASGTCTVNSSTGSLKGMTMTGGTVTVNSGGSLNVDAGGNGVVLTMSGGTINGSVGNISLNDLTMSGTASFKAASGTTSMGNLTISGGTFTRCWRATRRRWTSPT